MFSKKSPLPRFGDGESTIEDVLKFYKFWDNFQSWREFSQFDEYDVREA
jgi:DnaJ family protein C protein 2